MPSPTLYIPPPVAAVAELFYDLVGPASYRKPLGDHLHALADRLVEGHASGAEGAAFILTNWHPEFIGVAREEVLGEKVDVPAARLAVAREHGFESWGEAAAEADRLPDPLFEECVDAVVQGNAVLLASRLRESPDLVRMTSHLGHGSTLLHYVAANGVETWRQTVPSNAADITRLLIEAGADPGARASMYGGGQTVGTLLATSAHPAAAGVAEDVAFVLESAG